MGVFLRARCPCTDRPEVGLSVLRRAYPSRGRPISRLDALFARWLDACQPLDQRVVHVQRVALQIHLRSRATFQIPTTFSTPDDFQHPQQLYRGISLIRNSPPPEDHHRTLGIVLLKGPMRGVFLMGEVPL